MIAARNAGLGFGACELPKPGGLCLDMVRWIGIGRRERGNEATFITLIGRVRYRADPSPAAFRGCSLLLSELVEEDLSFPQIGRTNSLREPTVNG